MTTIAATTTAAVEAKTTQPPPPQPELETSPIKLRDLSELKVLNAPPDCIIQVVKATFILLGYPPDDLEWRHCKRLLGQKGGAYFFNTIMNFEPGMSSEKAIARATKILRCIDMEQVLSSNLAAAGLFLWCLRVILE